MIYPLALLERAVHKMEKVGTALCLEEDAGAIALIATDDRGRTVALQMTPEQALEVAQFCFVNGVRLQRGRQAGLRTKLAARKVIQQVRDAAEAEG